MEEIRLTKWYDEYPIIYSVLAPSQVVNPGFLKHQQYQITNHLEAETNPDFGNTSLLNLIIFVLSLKSNDTVDERNPKQPPGMVLKPCKKWNIRHINWCRIFSHQQ